MRWHVDRDKERKKEIGDSRQRCTRAHAGICEYSHDILDLIERCLSDVSFATDEQKTWVLGDLLAAAPPLPRLGTASSDTSSSKPHDSRMAFYFVCGSHVDFDRD